MYDIQCSFCEGIYYLPLHYSILLFIIKEIDILSEKETKLTPRHLHSGTVQNIQCSLYERMKMRALVEAPFKFKNQIIT